LVQIAQSILRFVGAHYASAVSLLNSLRADRRKSTSWEVEEVKRKILRELNRVAPLYITLTQISALFHRHKKKHLLIAALTELQEQGLAKRTCERTTNGRPRVCWSRIEKLPKQNGRRRVTCQAAIRRASSR
jgi:hypothetical protein